MNTLKTFLFMALLTAIVTVPSVASASTLTITVETSKPSYQLNEDIYVQGNLAYDGSPVADNLVAIEVQDPDNSVVVSRTSQTEINGDYNLTFKLPSDAKNGTYMVYVSSTYKGETATDNTTFKYGVVPTPWKTSFIGLGGYPIVDFAVYNGNLYAAADNILYMYNGSNWNIVNAPTYVLSLEPYEDKLIIGGKGGLYSYDGTTFTLIFNVSTYIKPLGVYNNTLYVGTVLDKPPTLYYCNGTAENPANWHIDPDFTTILNFSGSLGSIDSFAVYNNKAYMSSGGIVYSYDGINWSIAKTYDDVYAYLDMKVYNGKLYLATRDQAWRKPYYQGYSGFSGRAIEFDGENWTTVFDYDYWIYSLETYDGKLYAGTANKIFTYNRTHWETSFQSEEGAYYAISLITYDGKLYAGMGNGYIFVDPSPEIMQSETVAVPEFSSFIILPLFMLTMLAVVLTKKKKIP